MTKKEKIAGLSSYMTSSTRDNGEVFNHFADSAPEELKNLFLEHYNIKDLDYQIFGQALDVVAEIYEEKPEATEDEVVEDIYESAKENASVYTWDRLGYLDPENEGEISDVMKDYDFHSIADACAAWYDTNVEQAACIITRWINS